MKIFLDFDDTLFNTRAAIEGMKEIFEDCGISKELFQSAYRESKAGSDQIEQTYDFDAHIRKLQEKVLFDEKKLRNDIRIFVKNGDQFLFPDVKAFLSLQKKNHFALYILSFGTSDFQSFKIAGTKLDTLMEKIIITPIDKAKALQSEIIGDGHEIWFFDDRMKYIESVKKMFPAIQTVFVKRVEGRYQDEANEFCDYVVSDLKEASEILKNL